MCLEYLLLCTDLVQGPTAGPVGEDLSLVLIGGEEADNASRDHVAEIEQSSAQLIHLWTCVYGHVYIHMQYFF